MMTREERTRNVEAKTTLPAWLLGQVDYVAQAQGVSRASVIRTAVGTYVSTTLFGLGIALVDAEGHVVDPDGGAPR
ncbi:MAG: hypothetical protein M3354_02185 [Chloroflexota bacterium]|nr:hypothetical protein [Chloroflexota bacterium]